MSTKEQCYLNVVKVLARLRGAGISEELMSELEISIGAMHGVRKIKPIDARATILCCRMLPLIIMLSDSWDTGMTGELGSATLTEIKVVSQQMQDLLRQKGIIYNLEPSPIDSLTFNLRKLAGPFVTLYKRLCRNAG